MVAAENQLSQAVEVLLEREADPSYTTPDESCVAFVAEEHCERTVQVLRDHGVEKATLDKKIATSSLEEFMLNLKEIPRYTTSMMLSTDKNNQFSSSHYDTIAEVFG